MICTNNYPNGVVVVPVVPKVNTAEVSAAIKEEYVVFKGFMCFSKVPIFLNNKSSCEIFANLLKTYGFDGLNNRYKAQKHCELCNR